MTTNLNANGIVMTEYPVCADLVGVKAFSTKDYGLVFEDFTFPVAFFWHATSPFCNLYIPNPPSAALKFRMTGRPSSSSTSDGISHLGRLYPQSQKNPVSLHWWGIGGGDSNVAACCTNSTNSSS